MLIFHGILFSIDMQQNWIFVHAARKFMLIEMNALSASTLKT
jgi:hypothetical protein